MKTTQFILKNKADFEEIVAVPDSFSPDLVFAFFASSKAKNKKWLPTIANMFKKAPIVGCSTAGEVTNNNVEDDSVVVTAIEFEKTKIKIVAEKIQNVEESRKIGANLSKKLDSKGLKHVLVLSDGLNVNGSELVRGIQSDLPEGVICTGGLAGDAADFKKTFVINNGKIDSNYVTLIGFYGKSIEISHGSFGGWDSFGPDRLVTKSDGNVLYELDGRPALDLYEEYLGAKAKDLPGSGLLFPLSIHYKNKQNNLVRTLLSINKKDKCITYAGDIPEGNYARLMKANFERIVDAAGKAAKLTQLKSNLDNPELAILISCVGRKLVLKQRVDEELERVREVLGENTTLCGFYSYGEISPIVSTSNQCELHNQTMTITTFKE